MGMRPAALTLVLLLAIAAPATAQTTAGKMTAEGDLGITSSDAHLLSWLDTSTFDLKAENAVLTLVDDWVDVHTIPSGSELVSVEPNRNTMAYDLSGFALYPTFSRPDSMLLVTETGQDYEASTTVSGLLDAHDSGDVVLERSHLYRGDGTEPPESWDKFDYELRSGDALGVHLQGDVQHTIRGDFSFYLWGTTLQATQEDEVRTYRTGFFETTSDTDAGLGVMTRQHFVHGILEVHNGILTATGPESSLYGNLFSLDVNGVAMLSSATGTLRSPEGEYALSGGAVVENGAYDLSHAGAWMQIDVREDPTSVRGATVMSEPLSLQLLGPLLGVLAILGSAFALFYVRPALTAGIGQYRYRRASSRPVQRMTWQELRADGHRRMGCRAEASGSYRRALWHAERSLRIEPDNPRILCMRGSILRRMGRFNESVDSHKRAHEWLGVFDQDGDELAFNAYEAARASTLAGRHNDAVNWLRIAVRVDMDLYEDMTDEPDFADLREVPEFKALLRGWRSRGPHGGRPAGSVSGRPLPKALQDRQPSRGADRCDLAG